jgi:hypothetical protein
MLSRHHPHQPVMCRRPYHHQAFQRRPRQDRRGPDPDEP